MALTDQQEQIVASVAKNKTQEAAVRKALLMAFSEDVTVRAVSEDVSLSPQAPTIVFVTSSTVVTPQDKQKCWASLVKAVERFGSIEVVTFGGFGCELTAQNFARKTGTPRRELAVMWNVQHADGTTSRAEQPIKHRDEKLKSLVRSADTPIALMYGAGAGNDKAAKAVFATLKNAGCFHNENPVPTDDPGAQAAGQPDVPVAA